MALGQAKPSLKIEIVLASYRSSAGVVSLDLRSRDRQDISIDFQYTEYFIVIHTKLNMQAFTGRKAAFSVQAEVGIPRYFQ
jgi:hypothetical protein